MILCKVYESTVVAQYRECSVFTVAEAFFNHNNYSVEICVCFHVCEAGVAQEGLLAAWLRAGVDHTRTINLLL